MSNGNGSVAPSCPVSRGQQRLPSQQPGHVDITTIPPVHDLRSVITAINRMNTVIQHITRGQPQVNNFYPAGEVGLPDPVPPKPPQYERMTWREYHRSYMNGKVVNPDKPEQYVEVKTLSTVQWIEDATGHRLIYRK